MSFPYLKLSLTYHAVTYTLVNGLLLSMFRIGSVVHFKSFVSIQDFVSAK